MRWLLFISLCVRAIPPVLAADVDPGSDPARITSALQSSDPRAIAWGAWRVLNIPYVVGHPELRKALARLDPGRASDRQAIAALFQALIELRVNVPASEIYRFFESYPAESLIVVSHGDQGKDLLNLFALEPAKKEIYWGAIAAAAYFARVAGLAPIVLEEYVTEAVLDLNDTNDTSLASAPKTVRASVLGGTVGEFTDSSWPPVSPYCLASTGMPGDRLLFSRPFQIFARRGKVCDDTFIGMQLRHEILIALAFGILSYSGECGPNFHAEVKWRDSGALIRRLTALEQERKKSCGELIERLRNKGHLSDHSSQSIKVHWRLVDNRSKPRTPLPDLSSFGHVTIDPR